MIIIKNLSTCIGLIKIKKILMIITATLFRTSLWWVLPTAYYSLWCLLSKSNFGKEIRTFLLYLYLRGIKISEFTTFRTAMIITNKYLSHNNNYLSVGYSHVPCLIIKHLIYDIAICSSRIIMGVFLHTLMVLYNTVHTNTIQHVNCQFENPSKLYSWSVRMSTSSFCPF